MSRCVAYIHDPYTMLTFDLVLLRCVRVRPVMSFCFDIDLIYSTHWCITHECRAHSWFPYDIDLWPQSQIYRGFDISSFLTCNFEFCLLWHSQFIFDTWVYHLERMCCVHSLSRFKVDFWLQGQIYWVKTCLCERLITSVCRDICTPHTYVYRHERMCHINTWPLHDIDLWPQIKILFFYHEFVSRQVFYMYRYTLLVCVWTWCLVYISI